MIVLLPLGEDNILLRDISLLLVQPSSCFRYRMSSGGRGRLPRSYLDVFCRITSRQANWRECTVDCGWMSFLLFILF